MNAKVPKLPPVKILCNGKYTYVYTYLGTWQAAIKDDEGNVIKKSTVKVSNKKTIGKIVGGGKSGHIQLNENFLEKNPEFRNVSIFRNEDGSMTYKLISELSSDNQDDHDTIRHLVQNEAFQLAPSGKVIKSADGIPMSRDPASLYTYNFETYGHVIKSRPKSGSEELEQMWMSKLGPIAMLESCSIECCLREALVKTFAAMKRSKGRGMKYVRSSPTELAMKLETLLFKMYITKTNTYEGIEAFCRDYAVSTSQSTSRTAFIDLVNLFTEADMDRFQTYFIQAYCSRNHDRVLKNGLTIIVDGSPISHKNSDRLLVAKGMAKDGTFKNQINVQFICDADKKGLPLFFDVFDGRTNDVSAFPNVAEKIARHGLILADTCIVADRGYGSEPNMVALLRQGKTFVFNCRRGKGTTVEEAMDIALQTGGVNESLLNYSGLYGCYTSYDKPFRYDEIPVQGKRASKKADVYLRYHVFTDLDIRHSISRELAMDIQDIKADVSVGNKLTEKQLKLIKECCREPYDLSSYKVGEKNPEPNFDMYKCNEYVKYAGLQVIVTNDLTLTSLDIRQIYDSRVKIEKIIQRTKQEFDGGTTKAKTSKGLMRKLFLGHLLSILSAGVEMKIAQAKNSHSGIPACTFRSQESLMNELGSIVVEKYPSGILCKPISSKHAKLLKSLNVPIPKSIMSMTKNNERAECDAIVDEAIDEPQCLE